MIAKSNRMERSSGSSSTCRDEHELLTVHTTLINHPSYWNNDCELLWGRRCILVNLMIRIIFYSFVVTSSTMALRVPTVYENSRRLVVADFQCTKPRVIFSLKLKPHWHRFPLTIEEELQPMCRSIETEANFSANWRHNQNYVSVRRKCLISVISKILSKPYSNRWTNSWKVLKPFP